MALSLECDVSRLFVRLLRVWRFCGEQSGVLTAFVNRSILWHRLWNYNKRRIASAKMRGVFVVRKHSRLS